MPDSVRSRSFRRVCLQNQPSMVTIYNADRQPVLREPSLVAFRAETGEVLAVGAEAASAAAPDEGILLCSPLRQGAAAHYEMALALLEALFRKVTGPGLLLRPKTALFLPRPLSEVEHVIYMDLLKRLGPQGGLISEDSLFMDVMKRLGYRSTLIIEDSFQKAGQMLPDSFKMILEIESGPEESWADPSEGVSQQDIISPKAKSLAFKLRCVGQKASQVSIYDREGRTMLREPSWVAFNRHNGAVVACGAEASSASFANQDLVLCSPLREGMVASFELSRALIGHLLKKSGQRFNSLFGPKAALFVPRPVTQLEYKALTDLLQSNGAGKVTIIEEPIAKADWDLPASVKMIVEISPEDE